MKDKIVKIGETFYKKKGFQLTKIELAEGETAPTEYTDLTETHSEAAALSVDDLIKKVTETKEQFHTQTETVQSEPSTEGLAKQVEIHNILSVLSRELDTKRELTAALADSDLDSINTEPLAVETSEPAPTEETVEEETTETVEETTEDGGTPEVIPEGYTTEIIDLARQINEIQTQTPELIAASRNVNIRSGGVVIDRITEPENPGYGVSDFTTSHGDVYGDMQDTDKYLSDKLMRIKSDGLRMASGTESGSMHLGSFKMFNDPYAFDANGLTPNEYFTRGPNKTMNQAILASRDETCGDTAMRRAIPDCGMERNNLADLFDVFSAPNGECQAEFYKEPDLAEYKDGIEVWTPEKAELLCAAEDAYAEALQGKDTAALIEAEAALKLASKNNCIDFGCLEKEKTNPMQAVIACSGWTIERQDCSPESVNIGRRELSRQFLAVWNSMILKMIGDLTTRTVPVDNALMVNGDGFPLDACHALDWALAKLECIDSFLGKSTDRRHTMIIPRGLRKIMEAGSKLSAYAFENEFNSKFSRFDITETTELAATDEDNCPVPDMTVPTEDGAPLADYVLPTEFQIHVIDRNSYFAMARPDVEYNARLTEHSVKRNRYANEFLESFIGLNKDSCHTDWTIDFLNPCSNGSKFGLIAPACVNQF